MGEDPEYTTAVDLYSFAVMMAEIVCLHLITDDGPPESTEVNRTRAATLEHAASRLTSHAEMAAVIQGCSIRDPATRMTAKDALVVLATEVSRLLG